MDNFFKNCPAKMSDSRFLTDWRSSDVREQYIRSINGFVRTDEFRTFMQVNGESIMDNEWQILKKNNTCPLDTCIFTLPTRVSSGENHNELELYDNVKTGKLTKQDPKYPRCKQYNDYRMTDTKGCKY